MSAMGNLHRLNQTASGSLGFHAITFSAVVLTSGFIAPTVTASGITHQPRSVLDEEPKEVERLIQQLASIDFLKRDKAAKRLAEIGIPAIDALERARFSADTEIRFQALRIKHQILNSKNARNVDLFEARDPSVAPPPGWSQFSKLLGDTSKTRKLYGGMYRNYRSTFDEMDDANSFRRTFATILSTVQSSNYYATGVDEPLATVLFFGSIELPVLEGKPAIDPNLHIRTLNALVNHLTVSYLNTNEYRDQLVRLIESWLRTLPRDNNLLVDAVIKVVHRYRLKSMTDVIESIVLDTKLTALTRGRAALILASLGTKSSLSCLAKIFDDTSRVASTETGMADGETIEVQLRDVALAASIQLLNKNYTDYGFTTASSMNSQPLTVKQAGFTSEQKRQSAFEQWNELHQDGNKN